MTFTPYNCLRQDDKPNFCRMVRYLELLEGSPTGVAKGAFERLCDYLETSERRRISDELRTELKTVSGQLVLENYIRCEAQQAVDAQFGHIRRLSDMEKVDIHKIVAQRMQHHKEVVDAKSVDAFKARLDKFWLYQEVMFDSTADLIVEPETDQCTVIKCLLVVLRR